MKKIVMVAVCAAAMMASAAWEKIGVVQVADSARLSAAVVKIAEYTGNQMLGMMAAGAMQNPFVEDFGPAREGGDINIVLFVDRHRALQAEPGDVLDTFEFAVVYPIASSKDQFIAGHPGGVFTNGLYRVENDDDDGDDDESDDGEVAPRKREFLYYAFSADGRTVASSDVEEQAKIAIAESANIKPLKGNLARLFLDPKAWALLKKSALAKPEMDKGSKQLLESIDSLAASVGLYDGGVELSFLGSVNRQGILSDIGKIPLGGKFLAGAPAGAVAASESSKNSGFQAAGFAEIWGDVKPVLMKHGIRADYLKVVKKGRGEEIVFDYNGLFKYLASKDAALDKIDSEQLEEDFRKVVEKYSHNSFENLSDARSGSLTFLGYDAKYSPSQHFVRTMRGLDCGNASAVGVFSLSGVINALLPAFEENADEENRKQISMIRKMMMSEGEGACATMMSRKDDRIRVVVRIDADEFKPFGCLAGAVMGAMLQNK